MYVYEYKKNIWKNMGLKYNNYIPILDINRFTCVT